MPKEKLSLEETSSLIEGISLKSSLAHFLTLLFLIFLALPAPSVIAETPAITGVAAKPEGLKWMRKRKSRDLSARDAVLEDLFKLESFLQVLHDANIEEERGEPIAVGIPIPAPPPPLPRPVPAPQPERKVCDPCPEPPTPQIHHDHTHGACTNGHEHYFEYHQSPPPECICRLVKRTRCL